MRGPTAPRATELLIRSRQGSAGAADELVPLVYDELRSIAARVLAGRDGGTLNATALVHEAYLRLVQTERTDELDREHFFALASRAMRHSLVDHARAGGAQKRGGGWARRKLEPDFPADDGGELDLLALDEALGRLEAEHPRVARILELRYFAGLQVSETAEILRLSSSTIEKESRLGLAFLLRELS